MRLYHEVSTAMYETAIEHGLRCDVSGSKTDGIIERTDKLLDQARPARLAQAGVSRSNNLYAYLGDDSAVIDIQNGRRVVLAEWHNSANSKLLRIEVEPSSCYVSDLDRYDAVKAQVAAGRTPDRELTLTYWKSVVPLAEFKPGSVKRPEVMVTRNITPEEITPV
jgi:hypothetical protein